MRKAIPALLPVLFFLLPCFVKAQTGVNYKDVGVVMNINDSTSIRIANYFATKRNIPAANIIPVTTSADEEINDSTFNSYLQQIRAYLNDNELADSLNYLVTTKGCPLKILRDNIDCNASVESELMLMTPGNESYIGDCVSFTDIANGNYFTNPYFQQTRNFSQAEYAIYLVTRLDGYTEQGVMDMIDRSGPNVLVNKDSVLFVLDQSPNWASQPLNANMFIANSTLFSRGWKTKLNTDTVYLTGQNNVIGYFSWGSNDGYADHYTENARPMNTWVKGAIAETGVSTSGRSFQPGTIYGQSLIADLLAEGATGAKGYVYEPFTAAIATSDILFNRYTDLLPDGTPNYNLAESYYAASRMIGWMDVVVGDPKTSITTNAAIALDIQEENITPVRIYPNPANHKMYIAANRLLSHISITDMVGRQVLAVAPEAGITGIEIRTLPAGLYNIRMVIDGKTINRKAIIVK